MRCKNLKKKCIRIVLIACLSTGLSFSFLQAQSVEGISTTDYRIDPENKGELRFELENINFFKNNEFAGTVLSGYSLPGLWLQPKVVYFPIKEIKLEAGMHGLFFHGADKYPSYAYQDIASWKSDKYQYGVHLMSWFRAQMAVADNFYVILGNIYGGGNHRLIEPLYNPELNLTADPETGVQLLFDSPFIHADAWLNWQSFIFRDDTHKEAFTVGLSTRFNWNNPDKPLHIYSPLQVVAQHKGGEIDTIFTESIQTIMNGAIGVGAQWNQPHRLLRTLGVEFDIAGYYQQAGQQWALDQGYGWYTRMWADIGNFRLKASWWNCHDFISVLGNPLYGAVSMKEENATYEKPSMIYLGAEYAKTFGKAYTLGVDLDLYAMMSDVIRNPETGSRPIGQNTSFSIGVYFRIHPSFLLKRF